jgi:hypothetical protein
MNRQAEMAMQSAGERVRYDAITLATSALSAAKEAGAFDAVASAMMRSGNTRSLPATAC